VGADKGQQIGADGQPLPEEPAGTPTPTN
jgi:hypothetical protein